MFNMFKTDYNLTVYNYYKYTVVDQLSKYGNIDISVLDASPFPLHPIVHKVFPCYRC